MRPRPRNTPGFRFSMRISTTRSFGEPEADTRRDPASKEESTMFHSDPQQFAHSATIVALPLPRLSADDSVADMRKRRRPRQLILAAHLGKPHYRRARDLRRLLKAPQAPTPLSALRLLLAEEDKLNLARQERQPDYSLSRHLEIWIAALCEAEAIEAL